MTRRHGKYVRFEDGKTPTLTRRFSLASLAVAAFVAFTLASAPTAAAQETLVANCEPPSEGTAAAGGDAVFAQVLTAPFSGTITRAEALIAKSGTAGDYVFQIRTVDASGSPTNVILASATVPDASVPAGQSTVSAVFASPATVVGGQRYALAVTRPGSNTLEVRTRTDDDCAGTLWFGPTTWSTLDRDMVFSVFGIPGAPAQGTCKGRPATIVGTDGDNEITGTDDRDVIVALGGNDDVRSLGANDLICGGAGRDSLRGGKNKDKLLGQAGKDTLRGQGGKDRLLGKGGKDKLNGGAGKDVCKGGKKDDTAKKCEVERSI